MKFDYQLSLIAAVLSASLSVSAQAQDTTTPPAPAATPATPATSQSGDTATPAAPSGDTAVRNALGKQDTDVDQTKQILTQTLTAVDKSYSEVVQHIKPWAPAPPRVRDNETPAPDEPLPGDDLVEGDGDRLRDGPDRILVSDTPVATG